MNKKRQILLSAVLASALAANAQVTINVDASNPGIKVSPNLYGIFFEDINHAADCDMPDIVCIFLTLKIPARKVLENHLYAYAVVAVQDGFSVLSDCFHD